MKPQQTESLLNAVKVMEKTECSATTATAEMMESDRSPAAAVTARSAVGYSNWPVADCSHILAV